MLFCYVFNARTKQQQKNMFGIDTRPGHCSSTITIASISFLLCLHRKSIQNQLQPLQSAIKCLDGGGGGTDDGYKTTKLA